MPNWASLGEHATTERNERGRRPVKWSDPQPRSGEVSERYARRIDVTTLCVVMAFLKFAYWLPKRPMSPAAPRF